jgi:MTH538 TIR-like domain (DUF1863)
MPKKVFISYDHSEDRHYKDLLRAWDANSNFEFEFDQRSPNEAIDSDDASRIKQALTRKMGEADYLLVIVGEKSHKSKWMQWEIERAKQNDLKLKLAAVKLDSTYTTPLGLLGTGTSFAMSFSRDGIINALANATNNY